ncbi:MAG TPA: DUF4328 domain-containing protein [Pyrinomonadaceae bacterium]|jgi:hypothetical protein|nr:DUF4328 domain-containing protein [Pyrinomonadaceae bacterium]
MSQNFNQKPYASGHPRALLTILLLGAGAAITSLSLIVNATMAGMLWSEADPGAPYRLGESVTELLYVGVALLQFVVFIATAVAFLMWLQRAYSNLHALGAVRLYTTPGWAVAYFFIPFVNLVKPFQVMREIWRESAPGAEGRENFGGVSSRRDTPALIGWWWAFWIMANVAGRVNDRAADIAGTIEGTLLASWITIASDALFVIAAVLAILVVKRIDEMQEAKFRQMTAQRPPPPPESFETMRTA